MDLSNIEEARARMAVLYGENKKIIGGNYDKVLAVRHVNGTFVGKKAAKNVIAFTAEHPPGREGLLCRK
mgnify:CR=1 FL=1